MTTQFSASPELDAQVFHRTCHLCEAACGLVIETRGQSVTRIAGDLMHPVSRGHICPKATAIADLQEDPDRLRKPVRRTGNDWVSVSWDEALADIGARLAALEARGAGAALYLGNPNAHNYATSFQIPHLRRAMGTPSVYSASTLDQMPHHLVQLWLYGHAHMTPVPDVDRTQYLLILGANPLASNGSMWTTPDVRRRVRDLQRRGGKLVVIDPRRTETACIADEHHFVRPATDVAFLLALLLEVDRLGLVRPRHLAPMLRHLDELLERIRRFDQLRLSEMCGIPLAAITTIAAEFADGRPAVAYGRMGVSCQRFGTTCQWLIHLLNIATGNLDREGGSMFGEPAVDPVATGGPGGYGRFRSRVSGWPETLSEFPTATLAEEIETPGDGQMRALVTIAGNPVLSSPDGRRLDQALSCLELMVSIDMYVNETTRHAHYILPPCGPLQKDHYPLFVAPLAVRQFAKYSPALFPLEEEEKPDWKIVAEMAVAIATARGVTSPQIEAPTTTLDRLLRASPRGLTLDEVRSATGGIDLGPLSPTLPARLKTADGMIDCAPARLMADLDRVDRAIGEEQPQRLTLIGRRLLRSNNSWLHNSRRLTKGPPACVLFMNPADAADRGIDDGGSVRVSTSAGSVVVPVRVTDEVMLGVVSLPHGFGHAREGIRLTVAAQRPGASYNDLTSADELEPISGNALFNGVPVEAAPVC